MINSRKLEELHPIVYEKAKAFIDSVHAAGYDIIVTSTYRDFDSQNALYAQGRTLPGKKVTNAKGGQSFHNFRVALDFVPVKNGKPVWNNKGADETLWRAIAAIGKLHGFEWGGDWKSFQDWPHLQYTQGLTLADFRAGKTLHA